MILSLKSKNKFWAVIRKDEIMLPTLSFTRRESITKFISSFETAYTWKDNYEFGWRCKKILITPNKLSPNQPFIEII